MKLSFTLIGFILAIATAGLSSCSNDDVMDNLSVKDKSMSSSSVNTHRVPLSKALRYADMLLIQLEGETATRAPRTVGNVEYIEIPQTRANGSSQAIDTALYLVNYDNNRGFALLSADDRLQSVYAISEEGCLSLEDTVENKALAMCLTNIKTSIGDIPFIPIDSIKGGFIDPPVGPVKPGFDDDHTFEYYAKVTPWLGHNQRRWGQGWGFNHYCNGNVVGCANLASAQIMSYYKWPTSYNGKTIDWDAINSYNGDGNILSPCHENLAWLLHQIGVRFNSLYGPNETSTYESEMIAHFSDFGYQPIGYPKSFYSSSDNPDSDLQNGPLLVNGTNSTNLDKGHTWVIDGVLNYKESWPGVLESGDGVRYVHLYHCVWGWSGQGNGYFAWNGTKPFGGGKPDSRDPDDDKSSPELESSFINLRYWSKFVPIK